MKTFFQALKKNAETYLDSVPMELLSIESGESTNKDTGEISRFIRIGAEIPRGYESFSKCQISVKIPDGKNKLKPEDSELLEAGELQVIFENLEISYVDKNQNVYFRAENYQIQRAD